jgi:hypothetical protein
LHTPATRVDIDAERLVLFGSIEYQCTADLPSTVATTDRSAERRFLDQRAGARTISSIDRDLAAQQERRDALVPTILDAAGNAPKKIFAMAVAATVSLVPSAGPASAHAARTEPMSVVAVATNDKANIQEVVRRQITISHVSAHRLHG